MYHVSSARVNLTLFSIFPSGYGYIFPPKVLPALVNAVGKSKLIAMEDVYITGKCPTHLKLD